MGDDGDKSRALARLKLLYPVVSDPENTLPTCWNPKDKHNFIGLDDNNLSIQYKGQGKTPRDAASVRTNRPIPPSCGIYYFEVRIISKGRDGYMGIGLSSQEVKNNRLPGWDKKSYGYHGDDGNSFCCSGQGQQYGPTFTTNDVIGCCINMINNTCFFTKNGVNLGIAFKDIPQSMYPTVGLQTPGEMVEANFGQQPFVFDIEDYMQEYRFHMHSVVDKQKGPGQDGLWENELHKIVSSYLVHYGYCATAESFAVDTGQSLDEELASIRNRQLIQKLVLSGRMGDAISTTQQLYPGLLERKPNLMFMLKCRQFVEMINGSDDSTRKPIPNKSTRSRSLHNSRGDSPYRSAANSPKSLSNGTTSQRTDLTNGDSSNGDTRNGDSCIATPSSNGDVLMADTSNGNSPTQEDYDTADEMEVDGPKASRSSGNEMMLMRILHFGRELKSMNSVLTETNGTSESNDQMLEEVFSLLAYADPWNSPVGSQLDPVQREPVCAALNSAILESHGLPQVPALETILGQTSQTLNLMSKAGIASCAFTRLQEYVPLCKPSPPAQP